MAVSSTPPTDHAAHDALLLAALASGDDLGPADRARADALVRGCQECATLVADLAAIRDATADLPTPRRRRDFRLTAEDAARLRPSGWRRIIAGFGSPRARLTGPAALGLATLGIAGLLFASVPSAAPPAMSSLSATGAGAAEAGATGTEAGSATAPMELALPAPSDGPVTGDARNAAPAATDGKMAPEIPPVAEPGGAAASPEAVPMAGGGSSAAPDAGGGAADAMPPDQVTQAVPADGAAGDAPPAATDVPADAGTNASWLLAGSLVLLAAGLILGALRLAGTRAALR